MNRAPLQGIRVADFSWLWAGAYATGLLAMLGAEVIKIESMNRVDQTRTMTFTIGKAFEGVEESPVFNSINLNKIGETGGHIRVNKGKKVLLDNVLTKEIMPQAGLALTK